MGTYLPVDTFNDKLLYLIGGGSALSVIISIMKSYLNTKIIYSAKTFESIINQDFILRILQDNIISLTQEKRNGFHHGRILDMIVFDPAAYYFVAGPDKLIQDVVTKLINMNISKKNIWCCMNYGIEKGGSIKSAEVLF